MVTFSRKYPKWSKWSVAIAGTLTLLGACLPLLGQSQSIPSPEEALQQANTLSPEERVGLEIDEEIRDRLRFDPEWQEIHQAIQRDVMLLKWTDEPLENPVWEDYGANAYPLLAYYTRSNDPTRQSYGMAGIRALGKPYTTLWLEQQIQRRTYHPDFYLLTNNPAFFLDPAANAPYDVDWQDEFGLTEATTRDRLVQLAQENLEPESSPTYHYQFNLAFLTQVLGYEAVHPYPEMSEPFNPEADPAIQAWIQLEPIAQPTEEQIQEAIGLYNRLTPENQEYILVTRLGAVKAGEISPIGQIILEALAANPDASDRVWAIAELDRHGIASGQTALQAILNGDLTQLAPLSQWASYRSLWAEGIDRATQSYYLLLGMVDKYPQSRFARAAKAYGDLTGRSYFGGSPRPDAVLDRLAAMTPEQRVSAWQDWLNQYPDHPGADDATYHLARALQDSDRPLEAMQLWLNLMTRSFGDKDALYLAWGHIRAMLDVGLSTEQLETLLLDYEEEAIAPLLRYALAVHYARTQDYDKALDRSEGLDLTAMDPEILNNYYRTVRWYDGEDSYGSEQQEAMQTMLTEQRTRWQRLQTLQTENTPASLYAIASDWAGRGGWKNGYLGVWENGRTYFLPTGDWSVYYCQVYWTCNTALRGDETVRTRYQQASQNAIALSLYQQLLDRDDTPAELREKALYMAASTLLWQWENHPIGETLRIHAPSGVPSSGVLETPPPVNPLWQLQIQYGEADYNTEPAYTALIEQSQAESQIQQANYEQVSRDYIAYLDQAIAQLQQLNPDSPYIDDLLFSRYGMSGDRADLQRIAEQYPTGDRAHEARFLLEHIEAQFNHFR